MNFFKKAIKEVQDIDKAIESFKEIPESTPEPEEEWIWVEGYKGTDKDMKCLNYQYELGVQYDMPEDEPIQECKSGFHLCLSLHDVYDYYPVGEGNRFFKVKALVRASDAKKYQSSYIYYSDTQYFTGSRNNKLASKSIIFLSELASDEILEGAKIIHHLPSQYYQMAIDHSINYAFETYQKDALIEDGYSEAFAYHIISIKKFDIAHAVGSQKDLSMDVKVLTILYDK
jgi:hypothetical protein